MTTNKTKRLSLQELTGENFTFGSAEEEAFLELIRTSTKVGGEFNRLFKKFDLTGPTYNILRVLERAAGAGRCCGEIGQRLVTEVPDVTRLLDRLEQLGYVTRERQSEDRRMVIAKITEKGKTVVQALHDPITQLHKHQFGHLSRSKLKQLAELLSEARKDNKE